MAAHLSVRDDAEQRDLRPAVVRGGGAGRCRCVGDARFCLEMTTIEAFDAKLGDRKVVAAGPLERDRDLGGASRSTW